MPPLALLDAGLRGALLGLLAVCGLALARDRPRLVSARLGSLLALGLGIQTLGSTPWVDTELPLPWLAPLIAVSVANGALFWLFVRALFDDDFQPRAGHGLAWLGAFAVSLFNCLLVRAEAAAALLPLTGALQRALPVVFALLAADAAARRWRADLVEDRRRLRVFVVVAGVGYSLAMALLRLGSEHGRLTPGQALFDTAAMTAIVAWIAARLLVLGRSELFPAAAAAAPAPAPVAHPAPTETADPADERLELALQRLMAEQQVFRSDDLSLASLASRLGAPEYRLRRVINQRLGHRNFNAYINGLRLEQAQALLADPAQREQPILAIALDAGFQSIGPFNRAFKAATGLTPSEFRRRRLADS